MKNSNLRQNLTIAKPILGLSMCLKEKVVGDARFELATPWTQTKCATKLR